MRTARLFLRLLVVAGLGVDAYIHLLLAPSQPPAGSPGGWSQVALFYAEGGVAILAALLVLFTGRRWAYVLAFLVAASALAAVLVSRYVDIGALGPVPDLYEPAWYPTKVATTIAEAAATVAAAFGLAMPTRSRVEELARNPLESASAS